jgi:hypothetical protein
VKLECALAVVTSLVLMSLIPAMSAPRQVEDFCFEKLQQATLAYRRGAGEAFMANCIANNTPTPTKKLKYRKH